MSLTDGRTDGHWPTASTALTHSVTPLNVLSTTVVDNETADSDNNSVTRRVSEWYCTRSPTNTQLTTDNDNTALVWNDFNNNNNNTYSQSVSHCQSLIDDHSVNWLHRLHDSHISYHSTNHSHIITLIITSAFRYDPLHQPALTPRLPCPYPYNLLPGCIRSSLC